MAVVQSDSAIRGIHIREIAEATPVFFLANLRSLNLISEDVRSAERMRQSGNFN